jgi:hypothetical protein
VEPHKVNPPMRWWQRIGALDNARIKRRAREAVERHGLAKVDTETRRLYNDLILEMVKPHG